MTTVNYGLKGGKLDATKHIAAAIPRLLSQKELEVYLHQMLRRVDAG
jgi:hypothetical protein